jgi:1-phosphofructokinase
VHRADGVRYDAGGKGVNVASCLADWGLPVAATGLLGTENAGRFNALLTTKRIANHFVRVPGYNRINIKLVDGQDTTDINLPALRATPEALAAVTRRMIELVAPDGLVVLAGSVPPGCPQDQYAVMIAALAGHGVRVLLDTSGPAFVAGVAAPHLPFAVKPNREELAHWAGKRLETLDDVMDAAVRLQRRGIELVVVSMGAEGALFVTAGEMLVARLSATKVANTVGAGDAMVAGIVAALAEGGGLERIARLSTAFAVGKLGVAGPHLPNRETVQALAKRVDLAAVAGALT